MKKKFSLFIKALAVGAILLSLSGCIFFGPDSVITIQVTNNYSESIKVYVKNSSTDIYINDAYPIIDYLVPGATGTFIVASPNYYTIEILLSSQNADEYPIDFITSEYWYDKEYGYDFAYEVDFLGDLKNTY